MRGAAKPADLVSAFPSLDGPAALVPLAEAVPASSNFCARVTILRGRENELRSVVRQRPGAAGEGGAADSRARREAAEELSAVSEALRCLVAPRCQTVSQTSELLLS
jgi:hypothetical protein